MYLCLFVTSSSGMYRYSMEGEVGIYSMFFYIKNSVRNGNLFSVFSDIRKSYLFFDIRK